MAGGECQGAVRGNGNGRGRTIVSRKRLDLVPGGEVVDEERSPRSPADALAPEGDHGQRQAHGLPARLRC